MITFDEFAIKYKPIKNHLNKDRGYDGCAFETFGEELDYVCKFNIKQVWTVVSEDNEDTYILAGYHYVNRLSFIITEIEWETEDIIVNDNEMIGLEEAVDKAVEYILSLGYVASRNKVNYYFRSRMSDTEITLGTAKYTMLDFITDELDSEFDNDSIHDVFN